MFLLLPLSVGAYRLVYYWLWHAGLRTFAPRRAAAVKAHWEEQHAKAEIPYMTDSVLPVVEAGQVLQVRSDHQFEGGIHLEPTPGHTPDHFAVHLSSAGHDAVMSGDLIHSPLQCRYPHLLSRPDVDKEQGIATRRAFMERYCDTGTLICSAHFHSPSIGHFTRHGDAFDFQFRHA